MGSFRDPCDVGDDVIAGHARIGTYGILSIFPCNRYILNRCLRLNSEKLPQMVNLPQDWVNTAFGAKRRPSKWVNLGMFNFIYFVVVHHSPPLVSNFYVYSTMISRYFSRNNQSGKAVYLNNIFLIFFFAHIGVLLTKIQYKPMASQSWRHYLVIFGEITGITRETLFMYSVLLKHHYRLILNNLLQNKNWPLRYEN